MRTRNCYTPDGKPSGLLLDSIRTLAKDLAELGVLIYDGFGTLDGWAPDEGMPLMMSSKDLNLGQVHFGMTGTGMTSSLLCSRQRGPVQRGGRRGHRSHMKKGAR